jgi:hypothetical protein
MKMKMLLIVALAVCLSSSVAMADDLQGVTSFVGSFTLDDNGTPYFDNRSQDVSGDTGIEYANIGWYLTGNTTYFNGTSSMRPLALNPGTGLANPTYLNLTSGNADFYFKKTTPGSQISMLIEVAGFASGNKFGWYDQSLANPTLNEIFPGAATPGSKYLLTLPVGVTNYGFYLQSSEGTFYTEASRDAASVTTLSHFAVFKGVNYSNTLFIGMEDKAQLSNGVGGGLEGLYGDFNDMAIRITAVPLPGALLLLGAGMARLVAYARRRQDS